MPLTCRYAVTTKIIARHTRTDHMMEQKHEWSLKGTSRAAMHAASRKQQAIASWEQQFATVCKNDKQCHLWTNASELGSRMQLVVTAGDTCIEHASPTNSATCWASIRLHPLCQSLGGLGPAVEIVISSHEIIRILPYHSKAASV